MNSQKWCKTWRKGLEMSYKKLTLMIEMNITFLIKNENRDDFTFTQTCKMSFLSIFNEKIIFFIKII